MYAVQKVIARLLVEQGMWGINQKGLQTNCLVRMAKIDVTDTFFKNREKVVKLLTLDGEKIFYEETSRLFAPPYH